MFALLALALLFFSKSLDYDQIVVQEVIPYITDYHVDNIECATGSYPPSPEREIPEHVVNLDLPPELRWTDVSQQYSTHIRDLLDIIKNISRPVFHNILIEFVDKYVPRLVETLPYPYADEIKGIANATGIPLGEIGLYNIFYEIFTLCTSILVQSDGHLYHGRNLDFGLLMGWDEKTKSWKATDILRKLVVLIDFQKNGKTVFKSVSFIGYVGVLTGMKQNQFSLTVDERFKVIGGYVGIIEWIMGARDIAWMSFLTRNVMENANSFEEAKNMLSTTKLLAPVYFILGGNKPGQATVLTRGLNFADDWEMKNDDWYLVETNYDHWKSPPSFDDRRGPAKKCMNEMGQKNFSIGGFFNVLSTKPVLNKLTVYTSMMEVSTGKMQNYLQNCTSADCPFMFHRHD